LSEHEERRALEVLNEVARIATLDLELRPMLQRITDTLAAKFGWEFVALISLDDERRTFMCEALTTTLATVVHVGYTRELGSGVVGEVAATGNSVVVDDVAAWPNYVATAADVQSELCVPVCHHGRIVAVLNLESTRLGAFRAQRELLETVADQVAGAIASAQLFDELRRRARLMEMMSEVSRTALEATDLRELLARIVAYLEQHFPLRARIVMGDGHAPDAAQLVLPIRSQDQLLGELRLESTDSGVFTPASVLAFEAFADQVAGAIRFASLTRQLESKTRALEAANEHLAKAIETLHLISTQDSLTGIPNRRHFDDTLSREWRRAARTQTPLALLMLDIDFFKAFNDTAGHQAGDDCLRRVSQTLLESLHRAADCVARYGGEEFAILLPETDTAHAQTLAEMLRERIEALAIPHPASPLHRVTVSIGVAALVPPRDGTACEDLVRIADAALYDAKRLGRNRVA